MTNPTSADHSHLHRLPGSPVSLHAPERTRVVLPTHLTPFIGREGELASLNALMRRDEVRLVTLTGPGGVGKTRLALAVAGELAATFEGSIVFVALAPIHDAALVLPEIAQALGMRELGDRPLADRLADFLRGRTMLLILDNCEQVLAAATQITALLATAPGLQILATSRAPLHVSGERIVRVPPLPLPAQTLDTGELSFKEGAESTAVRLFTERAQAARADFALTTANIGAVAEVCRRLDGLPLAIELAAARVGALPPAALLTRLQTRLPLLTKGPRDAPQRLRTMRDAIGWSYDLLDEDEQAVFSRLSIFDGGFTIDAAEVVGQMLPTDAGSSAEIVETSVLDLVASLVDKSLLQRQAGDAGAGESEDEPRYVMLETVREFALEQLETSGEATAIRHRHAQWCLALAEQTAPWLLGPEQRRWAERLEREHANMRAALTWLTERDATESALRLSGGLLIFWFLRGHLREGSSWLTRTLDRAPNEAVEERIWAFFGAGLLTWAQGDGQQAETLGRQSLALAREHELGFGTGISFYLLFLALEMQGRMEEALSVGEQSVSYLREAGNRAWLAFAVGDVGLVRTIAGDGMGGAVLIDEGLALHREVGNKQGVGNKLSDLGWHRLGQKGGGDAAAMRQFMESVRLLWEGGDVWYLANPVAGIAVLSVGAGASGRTDQAARLLGAATILWERSGSTIPPTDRARLVQAETTARAKLGEAAYAREAAIGQALTVAEIVEEATTVAEALLSAAALGPTPALANTDNLSPRELDVLRLLAEGKSNPEIATALFIGRGTVHTHVSNILAKLGAKSRTEATTIAHRRGLV